MSQPKKRTSRSRRDKRRYCGRKEVPDLTIVKCPSCSEPSRPHRICKCGVYQGRQVIEKVVEAVAG